MDKGHYGPTAGGCSAPTRLGGTVLLVTYEIWGLYEVRVLFRIGLWMVIWNQMRRVAG